VLLSPGCKGSVTPATLKACAAGQVLAENQSCVDGKSLTLGSAKEADTADSGTSTDAGVPEADFAQSAEQVDFLISDGGLVIGAAGPAPTGVLLDIRDGGFVQNQQPVVSQLRLTSLWGEELTGTEGGGEGHGANEPELALARPMTLRLRLAGTVTSDAPATNPATCRITLERVGASVIASATVKAYSLEPGAWVQQGFDIEVTDVVDGGTVAYGWMLKNDSALDAGVRCIKAADAGPWTLNVEGY
jgi:hypothetical protein